MQYPQQGTFPTKLKRHRKYTQLVSQITTSERKSVKGHLLPA